MWVKLERDLKVYYCHEADILHGWVVVHKEVRKENGKVVIGHLDYVKIYCKETKKSIYCRLFGPGTQGRYYEGTFKDKNKEESIFVDAYYRGLLDIEDEDAKSGKTFSFIIKKGCKCYYIARTNFCHPDGAVWMGMRIGLISLGLGIISLVLGVILAFV